MIRITSIVSDMARSEAGTLLALMFYQNLQVFIT